jgi:hypothetical protein
MSITKELDDFICALEPNWPGTAFVPVGTGWNELSALQAKDLVGILQRETLAYGVRRTKMRCRGPFKPDGLFAAISSGARFYTNRNLLHGGWTPATTATFDVAVAGVDTDNIAIACVQDED